MTFCNHNTVKGKVKTIEGVLLTNTTRVQRIRHCDYYQPESSQNPEITQ